jgi:hypothetical protein
MDGLQVKVSSRLCFVQQTSTQQRMTSFDTNRASKQCGEISAAEEGTTPAQTPPTQSLPIRCASRRRFVSLLCPRSYESPSK